LLPTNDQLYTPPTGVVSFTGYAPHIGPHYELQGTANIYAALDGSVALAVMLQGDISIDPALAGTAIIDPLLDGSTTLYPSLTGTVKSL
jgi:hypothetical protein